MQYHDAAKTPHQWPTMFLDPIFIFQPNLVVRLNAESEEVKVTSKEEQEAKTQKRLAPKKQIVIDYITEVFLAMKDNGQEYVLAPYAFA